MDFLSFSNFFLYEFIFCVFLNIWSSFIIFSSLSFFFIFKFLQFSLVFKSPLWIVYFWISLCLKKFSGIVLIIGMASLDID